LDTKHATTPTRRPQARKSRPPRRPALAALVSGLLLGPLASVSNAAGGLDDAAFDKSVEPILRRHCIACHGPDETKGKLDLSSLELLLEGGKNGAVVSPGKSAQSLLLDRITRRDRKVMPPKKAGRPLSQKQVAEIRRWIDAGTAPSPTAVTAPQETSPRETAPAAAKEAKEAPSVASKREPVPVVPANRLDPIGSVAFSPDGRLLALGGQQQVRILDGASGAPIATLSGATELVRSLAWSPDGSLLAGVGGAPSSQGEILVWHTTDWTEASRTTSHRDTIYDVAFSPSGDALVTASYDRLIKSWRVNTAGHLELNRDLKDHIDAAFAADFTSDGKTVLSASADRTVKAWDSRSGKRLLTISDATKALTCMAIAPERSEVAAGGRDQSIRIWSFAGEKGSLLRASFAHKGSVLCLAYSPDGTLLASAGEDGRVKIWDEATLREVLVLEQQTDWVFDLAFRADGKALALGCHDGSWAIYDTKSGLRLLGSAASDSTTEVAADTPATEGAEAGDEAAGTSSTLKQRRRRAGGGILVEIVQGAIHVPPSLDDAPNPRVLRAGEKATVTISGRNIADATFHFDREDIRAQVLATKTLPPPSVVSAGRNDLRDNATLYDLQVDIDVGANVPRGDHTLFAHAPGGITNRVKIYVETANELAEVEPNDTSATANSFDTNLVTVGKMDVAGDADVYSFEGEADDEIVFHVVSTSVGSNLNSHLTIIDSAGKELARSDETRFGNRMEPRVGFRFPAAGTYFVRITDKAFGSGGHYRLYGGEIPYVTSFFPPGLRAGTTAEVTLQGFNLGARARVKIEAQAEPSAWAPTVPVSLPNALRGASLAVGRAPEVVEKEPNDTPATAVQIRTPGIANGVIAEQDQDFYAFSASQGETFVIDVVASRIGSRLDSFIEVLDRNGAKLERVLLRAVSETTIALRGVQAKASDFRLRSWADVHVRDLLMVGSEVARVRHIPAGPDAGVSLFDSKGRRLGMYDTTAQFHVLDTPVYKVEPHPPGANLSAGGMPIFKLHHENDDGGMPVHKSDSRVHFTAPADGTYVVRIRDVQGRGGDDFFYRLQVRAPRPDFSLDGSPQATVVNVPSGGRVPINVGITRFDDFNGEIHVEVAGQLPPGFEITSATVPKDRETVTLILQATADAPPPKLGTEIRLRARASIDGREVVHEEAVASLGLAKAPDVVLTLEPKKIDIRPGGTQELTVRAERRNGFSGRIRIRMQNLPIGLYVLNSGLNGILIPGGEQERTFTLEADRSVAPVRLTTFVTGRIDSRSKLPTIYSSEAATLNLDVGSESPGSDIVQRAF